MKPEKIIPWRTAVLFAVVLLFLGGKSAAQNARGVAKKAVGSIVLLATEDASGQPLSIASGFFVGSNVIATNAHSIEGAASGYIKIVGQRERQKVVGIVGLDTKHDIALLSVTPTAHGVLALADSSTVNVGDEIFAIGNPQGLRVCPMPCDSASPRNGGSACSTARDVRASDRPRSRRCYSKSRNRWP
jgi:serine protease Do